MHTIFEELVSLIAEDDIRKLEEIRRSCASCVNVKEEKVWSAEPVNRVASVLYERWKNVLERYKEHDRIKLWGGPWGFTLDVVGGKFKRRRIGVEWLLNRRTTRELIERIASNVALSLKG